MVCPPQVVPYPHPIGPYPGVVPPPVYQHQPGIRQVQVAAGAPTPLQPPANVVAADPTPPPPGGSGNPPPGGEGGKPVLEVITEISQELRRPSVEYSDPSDFSDSDNHSSQG